MALIRNMPKRKRSEHYVNNKEFLAALIKYREDVEIAQIQNKPKPVIPRYIGCLLYTSPSPRDDPLSRMPSSA